MEEYGYRKLIIWKNSKEIRRKIYKLTETFNQKEMRRVSQMNDAARSVKQNIQEGYFKSTKSFINYLITSRGSLNEVMGDLEDCYEDDLILKKEYKDLEELLGKTDYLINKTIQGLKKKMNND